MNSKFVISAVVLVVLRIMPTFSLVSSNGWIPLTKNDVLRKLDRDFTRIILDNQQFINPHKESDEMEILKRDAIKMVTPQERLLILPAPADIDTRKKQYKDEQQNCDFKDCDLHTTGENLTDTIDIPDETVENNNDHQKSAIQINKRRSKHVHEVTKYFKNIPAGNVQEEKIDITNSVDGSISNKHFEGIQSIYQVTENILELNEERDGDGSGYAYKYPEPNAKSTPIPNITNTFLDTLLKYNIKLDDDLPNYTLSRQTKGPRPNFMHIPIPLNIPPRFNSFNHFSVDPLLAVFLSNYGYYLPGSYGIQNKYKNLYGYLASNNIHNNKPFGAYKLYSDTDSSN